MSSEPIELTDAEVRAAAKAIFPDCIWSDSQTEGYPRTAKVVARVVEAVNRARFVDPVGTIRQCPPDQLAYGQYAIRVYEKPLFTEFERTPNNPPQQRISSVWFVVNDSGDVGYPNEGVSAVIQAGWPVVYSPDGAA